MFSVPDAFVGCGLLPVEKADFASAQRLVALIKRQSILGSLFIGSSDVQTDS